MQLTFVFFLVTEQNKGNEKMESHEKVARTHLMLSLIYGVGFIIYLLIFFRYGVSVERGGLIIFASFFLGALFALHLIISKGARNKKEWAKYTSIIIAVIMLIGFPIGTIIGIYLLHYCRSWT